MEQKIYETEDNFDFTKLSISQPSAIQGGAYVTKIKYADNPLYIQTPKCLTKQGLNETNKKAYIDLMYSNENNTVIEWFENLELALVKLIYDKRELWFQNEMELEDIENFFNPITRAYKGGKYHLVRVNIPKNKTLNSQYSCNVYDENENMVAIQDLSESNNIIPCLEVQAIKFSARNFQVDLVGKQIMILNNKPLFTSCMIKRPISNSQQDNSTVELDNNITHNISSPPSLETCNDVLPENIEISQIPDDLGDTAIDTVTDNDTAIDTVTDNDTAIDTVTVTANDTVTDNDTDNDTVTDNVTVTANDTIAPPELTLTIKKDNHLENIAQDDKRQMPYETGNTSLKEVSLEDITNNININDNINSLTLNNPNDVYHEIYKIARQKAREHKKAAITHYLEAKKIKNTYMLDDLYQNDDSSSDEDIDSDSEEIKNQIDEMVEELS